MLSSLKYLQHNDDDGPKLKIRVQDPFSSTATGSNNVSSQVFAANHIISPDKSRLVLNDESHSYIFSARKFSAMKAKENMASVFTRERGDSFETLNTSNRYAVSKMRKSVIDDINRFVSQKNTNG